MRIILFGASGGTGRQIIEQGLQKGYKITAFVRNPDTLKIKDKNLFIFKGDILDEKSVESSMKNQDAMVSVLGNKTKDAFWKRNTFISQGVKNIIHAAQKKGIRRFLFVSSFGVSEDIFLPEKFFIKFLLKNIFADIPLQEKLITKSDLDWTIIRPARLINGSKTEKYKFKEHLRIGPLSRISRADVADFILRNIKPRDFLNKVITISY